MLNTPQDPQDLPENIDELSLGELIAIARNRANLSQESLGRRTDTKKGTLHRHVIALKG
jgi:hypothetical protein